MPKLNFCDGLSFAKSTLCHSHTAFPIRTRRQPCVLHMCTHTQLTNLNPRMLRYHPLFVPASTEWLRLRNFHKGLLCGVVVRYCRVIVLTSLAQQHVPHSTGRHIDKQPSGRRRSLDQRHCTSKVLVVHELHPPHSLSGTIQAGTSVPRSWAAGGTCSVAVMSVNGSGRVPLLS